MPHSSDPNHSHESPFKGKQGWRRVWNALGYSIQGFIGAYRHESAFRQEVALLVIFLPLSFWFHTTGIGHALLAGSLLLVLVVELINSAIEATVDRISLENHHLAKRAKDIGSAAVLISLIHVALVWYLVLLG